VYRVALCDAADDVYDDEEDEEDVGGGDDIAVCTDVDVWTSPEESAKRYRRRCYAVLDSVHVVAIGDGVASAGASYTPSIVDQHA